MTERIRTGVASVSTTVTLIANVAKAIIRYFFAVWQRFLGLAPCLVIVCEIACRPADLRSYCVRARNAHLRHMEKNEALQPHTRATLTGYVSKAIYMPVCINLPPIFAWLKYFVATTVKCWCRS